MTTPPIVCTGRGHDDEGHARGPVCGAEFGPAYRGPSSEVSYHDEGGPWRMETAGELRNRARASRWAIGPNGQAMCPRCRRPDTRPVAIAQYGGVR
jgi:hypothetical protein